jgi:hypothetical protein
MPRFAHKSRYPYVAKQKADVREIHKVLLLPVLRGDCLAWWQSITLQHSSPNSLHSADDNFFCSNLSPRRYIEHDKIVVEAKMKARYFVLAFLALWAGLLSAQNMFGAFRIESQPQGADVIITASNQFIGQTPTESIPVMMDQFMTYYYGTPGRVFNIVIRKDGFIPMQETIFVPYTRVHQIDAMRNPTIFRYRLQRRPKSPQEASRGHYGVIAGDHPQ